MRLTRWVKKIFTEAGDSVPVGSQELYEDNSIDQLLVRMLSPNTGGQIVNTIFRYPDNEYEIRKDAMAAAYRGEDVPDIRRLGALPVARQGDMYKLGRRFARVVKSNASVANMVRTGRLCVPAIAESVIINPTPELFPLSFTEVPHLLMCLEYGDQIAFLSFDPPVLQANRLQDEKVWWRGACLHEYCANKLYATRVIDLHQAISLAEIVAHADVPLLKNCLDETLSGTRAPLYKIIPYLSRMGCEQSVQYWQYLTSCYRKTERSINDAVAIARDAYRLYDQFIGREMNEQPCDEDVVETYSRGDLDSER